MGAPDMVVKRIEDSVFLCATINSAYHSEIWVSAMCCVNMAQKRLQCYGNKNKANHTPPTGHVVWPKMKNKRLKRRQKMFKQNKNLQ